MPRERKRKIETLSTLTEIAIGSTLWTLEKPTRFFSSSVRASWANFDLRQQNSNSRVEIVANLAHTVDREKQLLRSRWIAYDRKRYLLRF